MTPLVTLFLAIFYYLNNEYTGDQDIFHFFVYIFHSLTQTILKNWYLRINKTYEKIVYKFLGHYPIESYTKNHLYLGSLQLFISENDAGTTSFPQIFFPAFFGLFLKYSFLSSKYLFIASLHSSID